MSLANRGNRWAFGMNDQKGVAFIKTIPCTRLDDVAAK